MAWKQIQSNNGAAGVEQLYNNQSIYPSRSEWSVILAPL